MKAAWACAKRVFGLAHLASVVLGAQARDSTGVRVLELPPSAKMPIYGRLSTRPSVTIDGAAADILEVTDVVALTGGTLVVGDGRAQSVRFFANDGKLIRVVGRRGDGPGEFRSLSRLRRFDQSHVIVYDRVRRASVFDQSGSLRMSGPVPGPIVGRLASGGLVVSVRRAQARDRSGESIRDSSLFLLCPPPEVPCSRVDTIGVLPNSDPPFTPPPRIAENTISTWQIGAVMPFGRVAGSRTTGDLFVFGDGSRYEIEFRSAEGHLRSVVRRSSDRRVPIAPADMRAWVESYLRTLPAPQREATAEALAQYRPPRLMPAFGRILTDEVGQIWIEDYPRPRMTSNGWTLLTATGEVKGRLIVPSSLNVVAVSSQSVICLALNSDDVPQLAVYAIVRR